MKIRKFNRVENGIFVVELRTEDWSQAEEQAMAKFGEPEIDLGGDFADDIPYAIFTLENNLVRIMSESPFVYRVDSRDYADAEDRATVWKETISIRIAEAVAVLRLENDIFTREEVETV